jgi:hypothetical protein
MGVNAQTSVPAFTAGQVLTAAEMTEVNTGIPVFATTVTRDAAFGGTGEKVLAQGQYAYIEATSTLQVYNGTSWVSAVSSGLVPIVPTSVAVGSGTGSASATGQVTFALASSVSLNGVFSSTYQNYMIVMNIGARSTTNYIRLRWRVGGVDNTTADYDYQYLRAITTTISANESLNQTAADYITSSTNETTTSVGTFSNVFQNTAEAYFQNQSNVGVPNGPGYLEMLCGGINASTSFDGVTFFATAGTFSGLIMIYGMAN